VGYEKKEGEVYLADLLTLSGKYVASYSLSSHQLRPHPVALSASPLVG
jgi:hypothetical protein